MAIGTKELATDELDTMDDVALAALRLLPREPPGLPALLARARQITGA